MALTKKTPKERKLAARKAAIYMFFVNYFFICRNYILIFWISMSGIRIAGGLVIMKTGFSMMNPETGEETIQGRSSSRYGQGRCII